MTFLRNTPGSLHPGDAINPSKTLHDLGQSLWLDNITRELLSGGTLQRYISEISVTGLTSNPAIFDLAIKNSTMYDADIARQTSSARSGEDLFFGLANQTIATAIDLHRRSGKPNLFIKIPGTLGGLPAIKAAISAGVPVNVTLLFSREQYLAAADAYLAGSPPTSGRWRSSVSILPGRPRGAFRAGAVTGEPVHRTGRTHY